MRKLSLLALVLGLAACRDSGGGGDDTQGTDSSVGGADDTIQSIQDPAMTNGTAVSVKGVVVTAIDSFGGKTGDFWIQEPEGGEFSGIHVFGAPLDQVAALAIGDVVDVKGAEKDDFAYQGNMGSGGFEPGYAITELKPVSGGVMTVTKTGANMVLQPTVVNALMIGGISDYVARDAEWEKWEGVLIKIENVSASSDQACVGSAPCKDPTLHKVEVTGGVVVESTLAPFPEMDVAAAGAIDRGECLGSVTGVLDYFFDYLLLPRTTAEYVTTGGTCATEDSMALCTDGLDNNGNGFMDCADNGCIVATASCRMGEDVAIADVQTMTPSAWTDKYIQIKDAIVMAVSFNKKEVWISTSKNAAANEGIQVHFNSAVATTVVVGKSVTVIGKVIEFNDNPPTGTNTLTELTGLDIQVGAANTQTPMGVSNQAALTLAVDATGEPYESVLVTLSDVKITTAADAMYHVGSMTQGVTVFKFDDTVKKLTAETTVNKCYASITGIWSYNVYDNAWVFLPVADGTDGTGC